MRGWLSLVRIQTRPYDGPLVQWIERGFPKPKTRVQVTYGLQSRDLIEDELVRIYLAMIYSKCVNDLMIMSSQRLI